MLLDQVADTLRCLDDMPIVKMGIAGRGPNIGMAKQHANVQTTAHYAHLDDGHLLESVQQIGDAMEKLTALHEIRP